MREAVRSGLAFVAPKVHVLLFVALLGAALGLRYRNIRESLPYCGSVDEKTWIQITWRMMRNGDLNPHRFVKPSLPVYMMLAGSSVGFLSEARRNEVREAKDLGKVVYPFYKKPKAVEPAKRLFAFLSVLALAMLGVVARVITRSPVSLWLAPLWACVSASYLELSWTYMNVDIAGAFFIWATLCQLVLWYRREAGPEPEPSNLALDPLIAGMLAGATIGCKYNLALILLPCLITLALLPPRRIVSRAVLLVGACAFTFLLTTPYALLDYSHFLTQVAREVRHYAQGHRETVIEQGWPMFKMYGAAFVADWGILLLIASFLGHVRLCLLDVRMFAIVAALPLTLLGLMSAQSTFFFRNLVSVQLFIALGLCSACLELPKIWALIAARAPRIAQRRGSVWVFAAALAAMTLLCFPWASLAAGYRWDVSSRRSAVRWILREVEAPTKVLVDYRLNVDTERLSPKHDVQTLNVTRPEVGSRAARVIQENPGALALVPESREPFYTALAERSTRVAAFGSQPLRPGRGAMGLDPKLLLLRLPDANVK
jgi:hypothetical protein